MERRKIIVDVAYDDKMYLLYIYMIFNQLHTEHPENFNYVTILEDDITDFLNKLDYRDADNKEEDIKRETCEVEQ